jgi:hypothetical protein
LSRIFFIINPYQKPPVDPAKIRYAARDEFNPTGKRQVKAPEIAQIRL